MVASPVGWTSLRSTSFKIQVKPGALISTADFLSRFAAPNRAPKRNEDEGELALAVVPGSEESHLEHFLRNFTLYLKGMTVLEQDSPARMSTRRSANDFLVWNGNLFRRTPLGLRLSYPALS